jgi:hypothetical protein
MADNFRHAQYRTDGTQIDDPQLLTGLSQSQMVALQGVVSGDGFPAGGGGSALPFVMPSSGTVASTGGSINSMVGLNYNPGPAYLYFPAGALYAASPAGWHYFVYGGATFGTVYANTYTNGIPRIPDNPTPLITVAGAYTQATGVDVMGPSYVVPANTLGPNGYIRWSRLYECLNNANTKACNVYFGGSLFQGQALASTSRRGSVGYIRNRGSAARNIGANGADGDTGTPAAYTRFTVDTTQAQTFSISLRLDVATDWAMIEGHSVELFRAA